MRKKRVWLLLIAGAALAVLALLLGGVFREREPEYGGKRLSEWVELYDDQFSAEPSQSREAADAIAVIGTNAIPCLMRWIQYETPRWETKLNSVLGPVFNVMVSLESHPSPRSAAHGFSALGPQAESAIEQLTNLLHGQRLWPATLAAKALGGLGASGLPFLISAMTNKPGELVAPFIVDSIADMDTNAHRASPALVQSLQSTNELVVIGAAHALGRFQVEATSVVPALAALLRHTDLTVRQVALASLTRFGGEARVAVPAIQQLISDPDAVTRAAAGIALREIADATNDVGR